MDGGMRSGGPSGVFVKNRNSSGCLIVRKKRNGVAGAVGSSSSRSFMDPIKEKTGPSLVMSDSESSDELVMPSRRRAGLETFRACSGLAPYEKAVAEDSAIPIKRERSEQLTYNEDGLMGMRGYDVRENKRAKLDVFDFDEYDGIDGDQVRRRRTDDRASASGERRMTGSMPIGQIGNAREYESDPSRYVVDHRKRLSYEKFDGLNLRDNVNRSMLKMSRDVGQAPKPMSREKYMARPDEAIRLQGKKGVLKVLVNKKKVGGGTPFQQVDRLKHVESTRASEIKGVGRSDSVVRAEKCRSRVSKESEDDDERNSDHSDTSLKSGLRNVHARKSVKREDEPRLKNVRVRKPTKRVTPEDELTPVQVKLPAGSTKEGKVKRGSGTEKQKIREQIRTMLLDAGWTIDYRPRRNRDYLDAVYINQSGTAYWSIIKAYDALQKQLNDDPNEVKPCADVGSSFAPIDDDVLSQLTRKTRKKLETETKKKKKSESGSDSAKFAYRHYSMDGVDSDSHEEKINTFMKHGTKAAKEKMNENGAGRLRCRSHDFSDELNDGISKPSTGSYSHLRHERKRRKHSRCALLVRGSNKGLNSEADDFVPYPGKRTVLSWLIDSGTVQLSEKVFYRRRKQVVLEGWVARDGIHCGCCSKILTVLKFELHAGSKLRQPFQRIFLESGKSLLQCQIDAWNRQEGFEKIRFYFVDVDGDDPNDDTCGICGDGGDLICCDGCPSTFHLGCLDIVKLPPGEWHCPNCSCKFCGLASGTVDQGNEEKMASALCACKLCGRKYHGSCMEDMDTSLIDSDLPHLAFCGKDCKELFEHLKKFLGAKHELEAGFSWSLLHRSNEDSDATFRGISQRVESRSKLAVGLTIMDECFLPIVDRRSGINLIQNVIYNTGSNFNRLNYSGFYAAVLEKGDEIISVASIRFHGSKLAEMPFIGTRHMYRRQGMCRRLLSAIELALCSLKVERLILPAIAELMHTWTGNFGFIPLEESLKKEMRSMNILVFAGVEMLQKRMTATEGGKQTKKGENHSSTCYVVFKSDVGSPSSQDHRCDGDNPVPSNEIADNGDASDSSSPSDDPRTNEASHETVNLVTTYVTFNPESGAMVSDYASHRKSISPPRTSHVAADREEVMTDSHIKENLCLSPQLQGAPGSDPLIGNSANSSDNKKDPVLAKETDSHEPGTLEVDSDCKLELPSASKDDFPNNRKYGSEVSASAGSSNSGDAGSSLGLVEAPLPSGSFSSATIAKDVSDENVRSDLTADASEEGNKMHTLSEATSPETHRAGKETDKSHGDSGNETL